MGKRHPNVVTSRGSLPKLRTQGGVTESRASRPSVTKCRSNCGCGNALTSRTSSTDSTHAAAGSPSPSWQASNTGAYPHLASLGQCLADAVEWFCQIEMTFDFV